MIVNNKYVNLMIQRKSGAIEAKYLRSNSMGINDRSVVLILHPNPMHGGSMNNRIVKILSNSFANLDFDVLRINFRGVGRSQGKFDADNGSVEDALDVIDWIAAQYNDLANIWVAGFAFGGLVCMKTVMRRPSINGFIAVSPSKDSAELNPLTPCPNGLLLVGEHDHTVGPEYVQSLTTFLSNQKSAFIDYKCISGADHYFSNHSNELEDSIYNYVQSKIFADAPIIQKRKISKL